MAATIPTTEPTHVRAGDTWRWRRSLSDYPAPTWTLTYTLFSKSALVTLTAGADGTDHLVDEAHADTAAHADGRYNWAARVTDGTDVHTIATGAIVVLPALAAATDGRSFARRMLDAIDAVLEGRATDGDLDVVRTQTGAGSTQWEPGQLLTIRKQFAAQVAADDAAERIARGEKSGRFIQTRFVR